MHSYINTHIYAQAFFYGDFKKVYGRHKRNLASSYPRKSDFNREVAKNKEIFLLLIQFKLLRGFLRVYSPNDKTQSLVFRGNV